MVLVSALVSMVLVPDATAFVSKIPKWKALVSIVFGGPNVFGGVYFGFGFFRTCTIVGFGFNCIRSKIGGPATIVND